MRRAVGSSCAVVGATARLLRPPRARLLRPPGPARAGCSAGGGPPRRPPWGFLSRRLKPCDPRSRSVARALVAPCGGCTFWGPLFGSRVRGGPGWALRRPGPARPRGSPLGGPWSFAPRPRRRGLGSSLRSDPGAPFQGPACVLWPTRGVPPSLGGLGSFAPRPRRRRSDRSSELSRRPLQGPACGRPFLFGLSPFSFLVQAPQG